MYTSADCHVTHRHAVLVASLKHVVYLSDCAVEICRLFEGAIAAGGIVKALRIPNGKAISNARIKTKGDVASESCSCPSLISVLRAACHDQDLHHVVASAQDKLPQTTCSGTAE